jgi:hypothetical protein
MLSILSAGRNESDRSLLIGDSSVKFVSKLVLFPAVTVLVVLLLLSVLRNEYADGMVFILLLLQEFVLLLS